MLTINQDAALFLLAMIAKNPDCKQPLRLKQKPKGCGDIAHEFVHAPIALPDDTVVESFGLTIYCNFNDSPDFADATVTLMEYPKGTFAKKRIVVVPHGGDVCGCGESARRSAE